MNQDRFLLIIVLTVSYTLIFAQEMKDINWCEPSTFGSSVVHNQLWKRNELSSFYDRLPAKAQAKVRNPVWNLSRNTAGLKLVFMTDAEEIYVRYKTGKPTSSYAMSHFPATGVSGIDLFAKNLDGSWSWANGEHRFKDTISYAYTGLNLDKQNYKGRKFHLYLPLYNNIEWLEIGVPRKDQIVFIHTPTEVKPVIVYGTSIAQGGCASRAGMGWTNLLDRALDLPIVNLAFSGNGRLEKEIIDLIIEKDAEIFILDCLPNLSSELDNIKTKIIYAVTTIRNKHPDVPIILADQAHHVKGRLENYRTVNIRRVNQISYETYKDLKARGIDRLYYLKHGDIGLDINDSVDGTHPTDKGMLKYASAYEKLIKIVLEKSIEK